MSELLEGLNPEQLQAVTHGDGPLMIIAGAGTGKTTVITRRIAWLIEQGKAKPENILALTFTDKAATEMEERVDRLLPMGYVDLSISTFHAFCERVLREFGLEIGLPKDFTLYNEIDGWLLMRRNLSRFALDYYQPRGNPTKFFQTLLGHFSRAKDEGISPKKYIEHVETLILKAGGGTEEDFASMDAEIKLELTKWREVANAYHVYQQLLLEDGALDFGDLLAYTVELCEQRPNILAKLRERFTYVVVDEFQDTNTVQYRLVQLLSSPKNNVTIVGDDDQAIYKFRGAALANILKFREDFPQAAKVVLVRNYRSGSAVLDAAYRLITNNNPHRLEASEGLSKKLISHAEHDALVHHLHAATLEEEVEETTLTIARLHEERNCDWSDFCVLVRGNDNADPFLESLERAAIPYRFMALSGLYTKPVILDTLSHLRVIDLPYNSPAMYRVISHPRLGISERDLAELMMYAKRKGLALCDAMRSSTAAIGVSLEGRQRLLDTLSILAKLRERAKRLPVTELLVEVLKSTGLLADIQTYPEVEQQEIFRQLDRFLARLKRFVQANDDKTLARFVEEFDAERDAGEDGGLGQDPEEGPDVVNIMTVHAAKGLEFKHVFVVNLVEQRFPSQSRGGGLDFPPGLVEKIAELDDHVAEERRLFYVAMTRAKEGLYLLSADDYGGARKKKMSRFLAELGFEQKVNRQSTLSLTSTLDAQSSVDKAPRELGVHVPDRISFSQIAAFSTCPQQYKYAHIIKVPSFGRHSLSFGKTMHNALQQFMEHILARQATVQASLFGDQGVQSSLPSLPELLSLYDDAWIDEWYPDDQKREEYREKGRESLRDFHRRCGEVVPRPYALEKGFTLKVGDILVKGRIDRIDKLDDGYEVVDYKTGTPKEKLAWEDRRQLVLYAIAGEECFDPPLPVKKLTYYYLETNTAVSFEPTDKEKEKLKLEIRDTMAKILASNFEATPGPQCKYCDFKDICPFAQV